MNLKSEDKSKAKKTHQALPLTPLEKRKKAIPVRKLLEMERQSLETIAVNDENDLSDANRTTSILGSLERLVESSFRSNNGNAAAAAAAAAADLVVARRMMIAKRALEDLDNEENIEEKKARFEDKEDLEDHRGSLEGNRPQQPLTSEKHSAGGSSTELKFLKYSELAKELSSNR